MAKDVVFESERYEKRQSVKRYLFPAIGVLIIVVAAVAVTLLLRGGREVISGGENTLYPYTWELNKNGTVTLELDHAASPGYGWHLASASRELSVLSEEEDASEQKTRFLLQPGGEGRVMLRFVLQRENETDDRIYELFFLAETEQAKDKAEARPVSVAGKPLQGILRGGLESLFPYTIRTDGEGDLAVTVTMPQAEAENTDNGNESADGPGSETEAPQYDWDCTSADESAAQALGVIYEDNTAVAYFRPGPVPGPVTLRFAEAVTGYCITLECVNGEEGSLQVISHSAAAG